MMTIQTVCQAVPGVSEAELRAWVLQDWVRVTTQDGEPIFGDIDVARVRLIVDLKRDLEVEPPTLPLILSLLDQLYDTRRLLRHFTDEAH